MARIDLRENEFIERFVGQDHIDSNDVQFWYQLLSCSFNFMRVQDPRVVEKTLDPYLVRLTLNNNQSFNIGSLIRVFLDRVSRIKSQGSQTTNPYYVFQTFNALYLIKSICKSYVENLSEDQLIKSFKAQIDTSPKNQTNVPFARPQQPSLPPHVVEAPILESSKQYQQQNDLQSQNNMPKEILNGQTDTHKIDNPLTIQPNEQNASDTLEKVASSTVTPSNPPSFINQQMNLPEQQQQQPIEKTPEFTSGLNMLEHYISALVSIIVDIPISDSTYLLQVESINCLLVLLSVQMYSTTPASQSIIYKCLMQKKCSIHALILTKTLLNNFVRQDPLPQEAGSIIIGLASGLWKVLTLGYGVAEENDTDSMPLLAKQSLLLLNILTNHYTSEKNPYREAIVSCQDSKFNLSDPQMAFENANNDALVTATTSKSALMSNSIKIDFLELYETICKYLHDDQVALLLYLLLHSNKIFRPYVLTTVSMKLDKLLLPLLKILYTSIEKGSHHVYMVLIIFIILSEETQFNEIIHKITIRGVPWYKDRVLNEISLGSLTALIIVRSFQYNTFRVKDKFLHTNLFATLANLSNHFHELHPYVCQRIVDLLERLSKRYLAVTKQNDPVKPIFNQNHTLDIFNTNNPLARALATDTQKQELQDASSIELDTNAININIPISQNISSNNNNNNVVLPAVDMHGKEYNLNDNNGGQPSPNSNSTNQDHVNISMDDTRQDINLIEEVIRMILEVINNSLATQLKTNPDLIYTLLYKRNVFSSLLSSHQSFYNMVINVERILTFFYNKIENYERQLSVVEIKDLISSTSKDWKFDQTAIDPNAKLLFHYVEDEQPEEFFIPYIWTRIYYSSGIAWSSKSIVLFNPDDV